jgi:hypothetical protein
MMRGVKKSNRFGILLVAAMTIPFWLVALVLWFTIYSTDEKKDITDKEVKKTIASENNINK